MDDPYYQVAPDEWMRLGPSTRSGKMPAGQAQPKSRPARPSVKQLSGTMEPLTQAWQEAAGSPAGDPPAWSTIEALLSAVTGITQGMDDIRSEMTDVRQQLSDIRQMQAGPDRPSQQPEPEPRPAESRPQQDGNGTGNQFPPDGWLRRTPAVTNSGRKPTFEEILQGPGYRCCPCRCGIGQR